MVDVHKVVFHRWINWASNIYSEKERDLIDKDAGDPYAGRINTQIFHENIAYKLFMSLPDDLKVNVSELSFHQLTHETISSCSFSFPHDKVEIEDFLQTCWSSYIHKIENNGRSQNILKSLDADRFGNMKGSEMYLFTINIQNAFTCHLFKSAGGIKNVTLTNMEKFCAKLIELQFIYQNEMIRNKKMKEDRENMRMLKETLHIKHLSRYASDYEDYIKVIEHNHPLVESIDKLSQLQYTLDEVITKLDIQLITPQVQSYIDTKVVEFGSSDDSELFRKYKLQSEFIYHNLIGRIRTIYNDSSTSRQFFDAIAADDICSMCMDSAPIDIPKEPIEAHKREQERYISDLLVDSINNSIQDVYTQLQIVAHDFGNDDIPALSNEERHVIHTSLTNRPLTINKLFDVLDEAKQQQDHRAEEDVEQHANKRPKYTESALELVDRLLNRSANTDQYRTGYLLLQYLKSIKDITKPEFVEPIEKPAAFYRSNNKWSRTTVALGLVRMSIASIDINKIIDTVNASKILDRYKTRIRTIKDAVNSVISMCTEQKKSHTFRTFEAELPNSREVGSVNIIYISSEKLKDMMKIILPYIKLIETHESCNRVIVRFNQINKFLDRYKYNNQITLQESWKVTLCVIICCVRLCLKASK